MAMLESEKIAKINAIHASILQSMQGYESSFRDTVNKRKAIVAAGQEAQALVNSGDATAEDIAAITSSMAGLAARLTEIRNNVTAEE